MCLYGPYPSKASEAITPIPGVSAVSIAGAAVTLTLAGGRAGLPAFHRELVARGVDLVALEYRRASLEDVYLSLTAGVPDETSTPGVPIPEDA